MSLNENCRSENILEVCNLRKSFPLKKTITGKVTQELVAVDDISFTLKVGETLGIVGESGCGKTTLGRTILKLHESNGGRIIFDGKDITDYSARKMREIRKDMQIIWKEQTSPTFFLLPPVSSTQSHPFSSQIRIAHTKKQPYLCKRKK